MRTKVRLKEKSSKKYMKSSFDRKFAFVLLSFCWRSIVRHRRTKNASTLLPFWSFVSILYDSPLWTDGVAPPLYYFKTMFRLCIFRLCFCTYSCCNYNFATLPSNIDAIVLCVITQSVLCVFKFFLSFAHIFWGAACVNTVFDLYALTAMEFRFCVCMRDGVRQTSITFELSFCI